MKSIRRFAAVVLLLSGRLTAAGELSDDYDARLRALAEELRCLVCQNQTLADSESGLANDMRDLMRELMLKGASDAEITTHLVARYGDFVRYRPPIKATTVVLWFAPGFALLAGIVWLGQRVIRSAGVAVPAELSEQERALLQALDQTKPPGVRA